MFIQVETTPNPETLKFLPGQTVLPSGTFETKDAESAATCELTRKLWAQDFVQGIFLGKDFISITKKAESDWTHIKPALLTTIMEYYLHHDHVAFEPPETKASRDESCAVTREIEELLETRIRPVVAQDGGDIQLNRYEEGIVYVEMKGACSGCPSSMQTLKQGIENMLKHYIPEVQEVRQV